MINVHKIVMRPNLFIQCFDHKEHMTMDQAHKLLMEGADMAHDALFVKFEPFNVDGYCYAIGPSCIGKLIEDDTFRERAHDAALTHDILHLKEDGTILCFDFSSDWEVI